MKNQQVETKKLYTASLQDLRKSLSEAMWLSWQANGLNAGERRFWSSVLLVRIVSIAQSLLFLCPDDRNSRGAAHWDFSSVASLGRNLFEAVAFFCYFTAPVEAEEWRARLNVMQLNDCINRLRYFTSIESEEVQGFEEAAQDLRSRLLGNSYFAGLPTKTQNELLQGTRASLYTLREMASAIVPDQKIWGMFDFLSAQTHTLPMSFYRTAEHGRTGVQSRVETGYIGMTMHLAAELLKEVSDRFIPDFQELISFKPLPKYFDPLSFPPYHPEKKKHPRTFG